ncbi:MAG: hypothetical protein VBE63_26605 [Lamprobacter sp.]|uniref:hypothetical protein n=1 Tax=Lamprobacter sp. TaxID=3100796 RepID=UPI002B25EEBF|nr:hypothetical protein [Lamprobacter sp.]MEA3643476.1 hypothetical protein [Lamprobacter sp.]
MHHVSGLKQHLQKFSMGALAALAYGLVFALPAAAEIRFELEYVDQGAGFDDPVMGAARKLAMEQSAQIAAGFFPEQNGVIRLRVDGTVTEDATLASAGSFGPRGCDIGFDNRGDVLSIALGGADPDPNDVDGEVSVNFEDVVWGLGDSIGPNEFDFKSTMIHELLHALGFSGTLGQEPVDACGNSPPQAGSFDPFDQHLGDAAGPIINNTTAVMDAARWSAAVVGGTGNAGLQWHGSNGVAANNGQPIPLFSPVEFSGGSSIAHLDDDFYTGVALIMEAATDTGQGVRTLSAIERGMMMDLGYSTNDGGGDGGGEPVALALNGQASGNLMPGGLDTYTITLEQAGTLVLSSAGDLDLVGRVLFNGQEIAQNDDDPNGNGANFGLTLELSSPGTYTLEVSGFDISVAGAYQIVSAFTAQQGGGGGAPPDVVVVPSVVFLGNTIVDVLVTSAVDLRPLLGISYSGLNIVMFSADAVVNMTPAIANAATLVLNESLAYEYQVNFNSGSVDIVSVGTGVVVASLPVDDATLRTSAIRIGTGLVTRIALNPDFSVNVASLPVPPGGAASVSMLKSSS